MKKVHQKKLNRDRNAKELKWYSYDEVFGKVSKTRAFKEGYQEEIQRIRLAKKIKEIRVGKNLTQEAVAHRAKMPQSVIARLESGEHSISLDTLSKVATALGKQIELA